MKIKIRIDGREYKVRNYINIEDIEAINKEEADTMRRNGYDKKLYLVDSITNVRKWSYSSSQGFSEPVEASKLDVRRILMVDTLKKALKELIDSGEIALPTR